MTESGFDPRSYYASSGLTPQDTAVLDAAMQEILSAQAADQATYTTAHGLVSDGQLGWGAAPNAGLAPLRTDGTMDFFGMPMRLMAFEDFQDGKGIFTNLWGESYVNPTEGAVAVVSGDAAKGGVMDPADGAGGGFGYGMHLFLGTIDEYGDYLAMWPADDLWPGPELDLAEVMPDGVTGYATPHWAVNGVNGSGGMENNGYKSFPLTGVDMSQPHFFWVDWQPNGVTFGVDDRVYGILTEHVPKSFADGGVNLVPGIGVSNEHQAAPSEHLSASMQGWAYLQHAGPATVPLADASALGV